jgi:hypothetical protein
MAATVYRYKFDGPSLTGLSRYVTGAVVRGSLSPVQYVDVTCDSTVKSDLDDFMLSQGFSFDSTAPATTVQAAASGADANKRLLEKFISGAAEGWPSGVYRKVTGGIFPSAVTWWTSSAMTTKIAEATYTRDGAQRATTVQWKMYAADGTTVLSTITDALVYAQGVEVSRTRTIA